MKALTKPQIIMHGDEPAFAVIPYKEYLKLAGQDDEGLYLPHEVVELCALKNLSLPAAWRVHKGLSQAQLAESLGVSQSAIAQLEKEGAKPRKSTLKKVADALGVDVDLLIE